MHSPRVCFNSIGLICTDSLRHGNGLSALLLLTRAAKSEIHGIQREVKELPHKNSSSQIKLIPCSSCSV